MGLNKEPPKLDKMDIVTSEHRWPFTLRLLVESYGL